MYTYQTIQESIHHPDIGLYDSFGVCVYQEMGNIQKKVAQISDIFLQRNRMETLVERCNTLQLDPQHLFDVIEDALD